MVTRPLPSVAGLGIYTTGQFRRQISMAAVAPPWPRSIPPNIGQRKGRRLLTDDDGDLLSAPFECRSTAEKNYRTAVLALGHFSFVVR